MSILVSRRTAASSAEMTLAQRIWQINWTFVLLITLAASIGVGMLYSAASGSLEPWAGKQMVRYGIGVLILLAVAVTDIRFWLRYAYVFYAVALVLLIVVEIAGDIGMG